MLESGHVGQNKKYYFQIHGNFLRFTKWKFFLRYLQAVHESELQATLSSAVIQKYTEAAQSIWNEISVNSVRPDFKSSYM